MLHSERQQLMSVIYVLSEQDLFSELLADKLELLKLEIDQEFMSCSNFKEYIFSLARPLGRCIQHGSERISKNALDVLNCFLFYSGAEVTGISDRLLPNVIARYAAAAVSRSTDAYEFLCSLIRKRHQSKLVEFLCNVIFKQNDDSRSTTYELITMIIELYPLNLIGDAKDILGVLHLGINSSSKQLRTSALSGAQALVKKIPNLSSHFPMLEFRPAHVIPSDLPSQGADEGNVEPSISRTISPTHINPSALPSQGADEGNVEPFISRTFSLASQPSLRPRRTLIRTASIYHKCDHACRRRGLCTLKDFGIRYRHQTESYLPGTISDDISHIPLTPTGPNSVSSGPSMPNFPDIVDNLPSDRPAQTRSPKRSFESLEPISSNLSQVNRPSPKLQKREVAPLGSNRFTVSVQASAFSHSPPFKVTKLALCQQKSPISFRPQTTSNVAPFPQYVARSRKLSLPNIILDSNIYPSSSGPRASRRSLPSPLKSVVKTQL